MRTHGATRTFLLLLAALPAFAACAVTQQQEIDMGANYAAQIAKQLPLVQDAETSAYLTMLGDSLASLTERRDLKWHFAVVDDSSVNAFAVPGGYIYVNRGLIERATAMAQVAGVVGHEIGHVVKRHSVKQMQKAQGANILVTAGCALTKACESQTTQAALEVGGSAVFSKFSRDDEAEADAEAVRLMVRAGIHPRGIPDMFRILLDERKRAPGAFDVFFASHPLEESRIAATQEQLSTYPAAGLAGLTVDSPRFQAFKKRLQGLPRPSKKKAT